MEDIRNMANLLDDPAALSCSNYRLDIRNVRRCGHPLNALEIIPSSSAHGALLP
jgi:hypothetical protein